MHDQVERRAARAAQNLYIHIFLCALANRWRGDFVIHNVERPGLALHVVLGVEGRGHEALEQEWVEGRLSQGYSIFSAVHAQGVIVPHVGAGVLIVVLGIAPGHDEVEARPGLLCQERLRCQNRRWRWQGREIREINRPETRRCH